MFLKVILWSVYLYVYYIPFYRHGHNLHVIVVELALPASAIVLGTINFDTTTSTCDSGDISSTSSATEEATPPRVYYSTHADDTHTNPSSPDFVTHFGSRITMNKSKQDKLQSRADSVLSVVFPKVAKSVLFTHVHLPVLCGGGAIANTVHKYTAPLSAVTDIQVCIATILLFTSKTTALA